MDKLICGADPFETDFDSSNNNWEFHTLQKNLCCSKSSKIYSLDWHGDESVKNGTLYIDQGISPLNIISEIFEA